MTRLAVLALAGALASSASATAPVKSETAASGKVRATIFYSIPPGHAYWVVRLVVDRAGELVLDARVPPYSTLQGTGPVKQVIGTTRSIAVVDLGDDREPEVLLDFYGGGAHCCFWSRIYRRDAGPRRYTTLAHFWGNRSRSGRTASAGWSTRPAPTQP